MRLTVVRRVAVILALVILAACRSSPPKAETLPLLAPAPPKGNFVLYVSNQSFKRPLVDITITIDDVRRVGQVFDVKGQHNWIAFAFDLDRGTHELRATSTGGDAELSREFVTTTRHYGLVDYWCCDPSMNEPRFTWSLSDTPFAFG